MPLFGSLMSEFDDDPFFGGHRNMMRQMDEMMSAMTADPFLGGGRALNPAFPPLMGMPQAAPGPIRRHDPFNLFAMPGMNMLATMGDMTQGGNCHSFSSSSVMTMTTGPDGNPQKAKMAYATNQSAMQWQQSASSGLQVYQATSSTHAGPDGVKETRRTMSDSTTGMKKMAIGHHINERSHVIEKEQNRSGDIEERQEFINLEEEDAPRFDAEFRRRIQPAASSLEYRPRYRQNNRGPHRSVPALPSSSNYRRRSRPLLSITSGSSHEDRQRRRDRDERGARGDHRHNPTM